MNDSNFKVEDELTNKAIRVAHYDRPKKYNTREKAITPEPQAKKKQQDRG